MSLTEMWSNAEANRDDIEDRSERISAAMDAWYEQGLEAWEPGRVLEQEPALTGDHPVRLVAAFCAGWRRAETEGLVF